MATSSTNSTGPVLECLSDPTNHTYSTPSKCINDGDDLTFFLSSSAYRDLMTWTLQLNRSMFPAKDAEGKIQQSRLNTPPKFSKAVQNLKDLISDLSDLTKKAPPDTGPRRFGNVAFRTWYNLVEEAADGLCEKHLGHVLRHDRETSKPETITAKEELKVYLLGSFGSAQRLDYGTGHELSFLAFLGCLWKLGAFEHGDERAIVMGVIQP